MQSITKVGIGKSISKDGTFGKNSKIVATAEIIHSTILVAHRKYPIVKALKAIVPKIMVK